MVLNVHRNHTAYQGRGEVGGMRGGGYGGGKKKIICLSLHWHHQNDSCTKMGSDESQFNISSIVKEKKKMDDGVARFFTRFGGNLFIC